MSNTTTATYSVTVASVTDALKATTQAENKLQQAGANVLSFFNTREAFRAVSKQFKADAIIPALDKKYQAWLQINVKDTDAESPEGKQARANIATARGFVASYFTKIENHAFPKEKTESAPTDENMSFVKNAIALARKGQKLENPPASWNMVKIMGHMNAMLKEMSVTSETETDEL